MLCERCGKNQATVHVKKVINGKETQENLCEVCAGDVWSFGDLDLNKLFSAGMGGQRALVCDGCGQSLAEFNSSGRLGCSRCYQSFAEQLAPVIRRFHGAKRHVGKVKLLSGVPEGAAWRADPALADKNYERLALQKQLEELVALEKFEEAAGVRDNIRRLDDEISRMMAQTPGGTSDAKAGER
ncbi:MAG: UvrB/UvrC motif-containing protein [Firmicutes bacterium]|nr:UvrB/UvrC motif-containing protein [Bacillota bacterium]